MEGLCPCGHEPRENLSRLRFVRHETHMEKPRREHGTPAEGGKRLTDRATRLPKFLQLILKFQNSRNLIHSVRLYYYSFRNLKYQVSYYVTCVQGISYR